MKRPKTVVGLMDRLVAGCRRRLVRATPWAISSGRHARWYHRRMAIQRKFWRVLLALTTRKKPRGTPRRHPGRPRCATVPPMSTFTLAIRFSVLGVPPLPEAARVDAMFLAQSAIDALTAYYLPVEIEVASLVRGTGLPHPWTDGLGVTDSESEWIDGLGTLTMAARGHEEIADPDAS